MDALPLGSAGLRFFRGSRSVRPRQLFSEALVRCRVCLLRAPRMSLPAGRRQRLLRAAAPRGLPPALPRPPTNPSTRLDSLDGVCFRASMSRRYAASHNPRVSAAAELAARICNTHRWLGGSASTAKSRARQVFGSSRAPVRFLEQKAVTRTSGFRARATL